MSYYPSLEDLREGRVSIEDFMASRNNFTMQPIRIRECYVKLDGTRIIKDVAA